MSHGIIDKLTGDKIATAGFEQADSALSATSEKPLQNKIINTELAKTYRDTDSTETTIADDDSFPFYDLSATAKKKTLWSNIVTTLGSTFSTITQLGKVSDKVSKSSDSYSDSTAYKVNDYVIYNDTLYRCKTTCSAGSWSTNQSCFEVSSLTTAITSANSQISDLNNSLYRSTREWRPQIYDVDTYIRDFPVMGQYVKIGQLVIGWASVNNPDLSGITTMLQIRNCPCKVLGGQVYIAADPESGSQLTAQITGNSNLYFRPNWVSSRISNPSAPGWVTLLVIGLSE